MKIFSFAAITLGVSVFLSACGGGGGGQTAMQSMDPPSGPTTVDTQTAFGAGGSRPSTSPPSFSSLTGSFNQSDPVFGSVAMNLYTPGLASVRSAETTFNGDRFTLSVEREDGSGFVLDTDQHYTETIADSTTANNPVTNRPFVLGYMIHADNTQLTGTGGVVEWSRTDVTDYLAGGYWLHVDADGEVEMGAFIDGSAYSSAFAYDFPVTGTASYNGSAAGAYVGAAGSDTIAPGVIEFGEYQGDATLTANFGTMQIQGRVDNIEFFDIVGWEPDSNQVAYSGQDSTTDIEMVLHPAAINANGTFVGSNVEFTSRADYAIASSVGSWAGQLSNIADSRGMPRAVAGTHIGYLETTGGSRAFLTGSFYGATERFE